MVLLSIAAAALAAAALVVHASTALVAWRRCRADVAIPAAEPAPPVSIVRPVHGLDGHDAATLASTFELDYPGYEIVFCAERETDPAVGYLRRLMARNPGVDARLLVGNATQSPNPKLDNIEKGWSAARHDWIVLSDANVLMPPDYLRRLLAAWRRDTGLVSAPPIGSAPRGFWAEVECGFLNTYQARWQYAADSVGYGFAQGKNLLWRRNDLDAAGGIAALASDIAEDAAATKLVRRSGKRVRLADRPFQQPLGARTLKQVWARQMRWAQLRRASFPLQFAPEILTTSHLPLAAGSAAAWTSQLDVPLVAAGILASWLSVEALLARSAGWHLSWRSPAAWMVRDFMLIAVWSAAWSRSGYEWRGKLITAHAGGSRATASSGLR